MNRNLFKTAVFLFVVLFGCCSTAQKINSLPTVSSLPTRSVLTGGAVGRTLFTITGGDLRLPTFSPDGARLAYASQVFDKHGDYATIFVRDLSTSRTVAVLGRRVFQKLLGPQSSSYPWGLRWISNQRLRVEIADGNEGGINVEMDVSSGRIVHRKYWPGDTTYVEGEDDPIIRRAFKKAGGGDLFELESALSEAVRTIPYTLLLPVRNTLWSVDTNGGGSKAVLDITGYQLDGSFRSGQWTILLFSGEKDFRLLAMNGPTMFVTDDLQIYSFQNDPEIRHVSTNAPRAVFTLEQGGSSSSVVAAALYWNGRDFYRLTDTGDISEVSANPAGTRICEVRWQGNKRMLVVKELHLPDGKTLLPTNTEQLLSITDTFHAVSPCDGLHVQPRCKRAPVL